MNRCLYCWESIPWGEYHIACEDDAPADWDTRYPWEVDRVR